MKASDNPFPSILIVETAAPTAPAAGNQRAFIDPADHKLKRIDSSGAVTVIEGGGGSSGALTKISETVLAASAASVTFSSIAGTYSHLRIIFQARSDAAQSYANLTAQFNADTAANYDGENLRGNSSTASAGESFGGTAMNVGEMTAATATANKAGSGEILFPNYARTTFHKQAVGISHTVPAQTTTNADVWQHGGTWRSTAAITQILLKPNSGNFIAGSVFTLYGIA